MFPRSIQSGQSDTFWHTYTAHQQSFTTIKRTSIFVTPKFPHAAPFPTCRFSNHLISLLAQLLTRGLPPPAHFSCSLPHPHCLEQQETQSRTQISGTRVNTGCLASRYSTTVVTKILGSSYKRNIKKENLVREFGILSLGPLHLPFTRRKHAHTRTQSL